MADEARVSLRRGVVGESAVVGISVVVHRLHGKIPEGIAEAHVAFNQKEVVTRPYFFFVRSTQHCQIQAAPLYISPT